MSQPDNDGQAQRRANAFEDIFFAALKDAANERKITQLKCVIDDEKGKVQHCRIIILPEKMDFESTTPLESKDT